MTKVTCPYCGATAEKVSGREIYPHRKDLYQNRFYLCTPCGAYVGCRQGTSKPLGRLANAELRGAKRHVHRVFDPLWLTGDMSRREAYSWLSKQLGIPPARCHIGEFDVVTCRRVVDACLNRG